jgi:hypothetical protein
MEQDFDSLAAQGLSRYIRLVSQALGLTGVSSYVQWAPLANAYIALDDRLSLFPSRDVALVWDEERGWAVGVESDSAADLIIVSYLGVDVLPAPPVVAGFARDVINGEQAGRARPSTFRRVNHDDDLRLRLTDYARIDRAAPG